MKLSAASFENAAQRLSGAGGGTTGIAAPEFAEWLDSSGLPRDFVDFVKHHSPKTELWAGAGFLFDELTIMRRNTDFSQAMQAGLFILGSAPNGDLIVIDLKNVPGAVGYLMHERLHSVYDVRSLFIPICESIGDFLSRINDDNCDLPQDYFEAFSRRAVQQKFPDETIQ